MNKNKYFFGALNSKYIYTLPYQANKNDIYTCLECNE
jgi:hypothetical protein